MSSKPKKKAPARPRAQPCPQPGPGRSRLGLLSWLALLIVAAALLAGGWFAWFLNTPLTLKQTPQIVTVRQAAH